MRPDDLSFLETALESFIWAAINRVASSDARHHQFRFTAADMGRQRVHDAFVHEVTGFFADVNGEVTYDDQRAAFLVTIDLDSVLMNPAQAKAFSTACEMFRADHG
jgi:polyisoprenoid-binding protein YceI